MTVLPFPNPGKPIDHEIIVRESEDGLTYAFEIRGASGVEALTLMAGVTTRKDGDELVARFVLPVHVFAGMLAGVLEIEYDVKS